ncbi:hypothetical protein F4778DRAFT_583849 [Xylariomycetidae sp. FL2044]|nr:hypothetical protein F4778DRAFT_583849 [Xylariomycetidae sp. FL2044]
MEQPKSSTPTGTPNTVPPTRSTPTSPLTSCPATNKLSHIPSDISNSVPSLRFPRPLGNKQLTNWVSSSSPDIMRPGNIADDDPSLSELGYDVIGTDGESQAESTTSSFDYHRPDDVQSLAGTDNGTDLDTNEADTESSDSDEEDTVQHDMAMVDATDVETFECAREDDDVDVEKLANQSLENPTSFAHQEMAGFHRLALDDQIHARELLDAMHKFTAPTHHSDSDDKDDGTSLPSIPMTVGSQWARLDEIRKICRAAYRHVRDNARLLAMLSGLVVLYAVIMVTKFGFFSSPTTRGLSVVPVASVSSVTVPSVAHGVSTTNSKATSTATSKYKALQTDSSSKSLVPLTYGKDKTLTSGAHPTLKHAACSVELYSRNQMIIKIPHEYKSAWQTKNAILIAVSRGGEDVPTSNLSWVDEGVLIDVPLTEAHGVLSVSIATTRKPTIRKTFRVNFSGHRLTEAFDAGRQLVKCFAQRVVDTVNETTMWVEETYIPALDIVSKQVCDQTASVSDSLWHGLRTTGNAAMSLPRRLGSQVAGQVQESINSDKLSSRVDQVRLGIARQVQDARDEFALTLLTAQLNSRLWWLKMQGNEKEYDRYLGRADAYFREKRASADIARRQRGATINEQILSHRKQESRESRTAFWNKV